MRWHPPVPGAGAVAPVRTGGASRLFRFDEASLPARYRRRAQSRYRRDRGRFPIIRVRPALPVRFVAGSAVGFPDVSIGRRIAGIAGSGRRAGNRFRLRGRAGVPWGAVRGPGRAVVRRGRVRPVGRRAGGFDKGGVSARWRAERRLLLCFLLVETGHGAAGGGLAGGVPGYRRLRSPASCLHDRGHLDTLRPGEVLGHPDPASVA